MQNIQKYRSDLDDLVFQGSQLLVAMRLDCYPESTDSQIREALGEKSDKYIEKLPNFTRDYQSWYSEAKALIRQLLPDRLEDLDRHYHKPKPRKEITFESYRIEDYLQGLKVTRWSDNIVNKSAAIPHFEQQLAILKSVEKRFESSLFDIKQIVQADLFDTEIDAAGELRKKGFLRAAGAIAGVVLEKHLGQVCDNHKIKFRKKKLTISDLNDALKKEGVIETPQWRSIQYLGDLRNLCDHNSDEEPSESQVEDLLEGTARLTKTLF